MRLNEIHDWRKVIVSDEIEAVIESLSENGLTIRGGDLEKFKASIRMINGRFAGCYIFFDKSDNVLYVGTSVDLRSRLNNHFGEYDQNTKYYIDRVAKVLIVSTESDSGGFEKYLIRKLKPMFNGPHHKHTRETIGDYVSFYDRRMEVTEYSCFEFENLTKEWYEHISSYKSTRIKQSENPEIKEVSTDMKFSIAEVKKYMPESSFDRFILEHLKDYFSGKLSDKEHEIIKESLDRVLKNIA